MFTIGVVCEGQTDFVALKKFLEEDFGRSPRKIRLSLIQPAFDNSLPSGWSSVLYWLENNPHNFRKALYSKNDSLFEIEDEDEKFDALIFQIDTDIIGDRGFENFISKRNISYPNPLSNIDRGNAIRRVIFSLAGHSSNQSALNHKEIAAPIVESSEAWIVAAENSTPNAELLIGQYLVDAYGKAVALANGRNPNQNYARINKKVAHRERVCELLISRNLLPKTKSHHYDELVSTISNL